MKKISVLPSLRSVFSAAVIFTASMSSYALTPFNATYQFSYNNKNVGDATRKLSLSGNVWTYLFSAKIPVLGSASEVSKFSISNNRIQSISFNRNTKVLMRSDSTSYAFKPQQKQIITNRKGEQRVLTWQSGVLDDLNAELQVRIDLENGGIKAHYPVASYKKVENRQFVKVANEKVTAADGKSYDTVKIRLSHSNGERTTYFWIAPSLQYLPVKVAHQDKKNSYSLLLKKLN